MDYILPRNNSTSDYSLKNPIYMTSPTAKKPVQKSAARKPSSTNYKKYGDDEYYFDSDEARRYRRQERARQRKEQALRQRAAVALTALFVTAGSVAGISLKNNAKTDTKNDYVEPNISYEMSSEDLDITQQLPIEEFFEYSEETEEVVPSASDILNENPELQAEYDKLNEAITRFSNELGEDCLPLIKERVDKLGNGRVEVMDVLKILWIESRGRIYEPNNSKKILESYTGEAFGPFQITPGTMKFVNDYYRLTGTDGELDIMNPYDNLDACILNLRFLHAKRGKDIESGEKLPTGCDLKSAIVWSYHDGAWATKLTSKAEKYVESFNCLSQIDNFPQLIAFILN